MSSASRDRGVSAPSRIDRTVRTVPAARTAPTDSGPTSTAVRRRAILSAVGASLAAGCLDGSGRDGGEDGGDGGPGTDPGTPGPPSVASTAFDDGEGDCGGDDAATITSADRTVVVTGRVRTPGPCYGLALAAADYDAADALTVVVAVENREPGGCVECVGEVPYEARVAFDRGLPGTVVVRHRRGGETVEVTRASP